MAYLNSRVGQDQNDQMSPGGLEGYTIQGRCNKPLFAQLLVVFCRERDVWVRPKPIWVGPWQQYRPGQVCTQGQLDEVSFNSVHLTFKLWFVAVAYSALILEGTDARMNFICFFSYHARVVQLINRLVLDVFCLKKFKKKLNVSTTTVLKST